MLISEEMTYFHGSNPVALRDNDDVSDRLLGNSIPPRYRDGMGGINLQQVRLDQRRARREVVRAMIRRLGNR